jgi:hypothetical protein
VGAILGAIFSIGFSFIQFETYTPNGSENCTHKRNERYYSSKSTN